MKIEINKIIGKIGLALVIIIPIITIAIIISIISANNKRTTHVDYIDPIIPGITTFNGKFEKYFGKQSGSTVLSLISQVIESNRAAKNSGSNRIVSISLSGQGYVNDVTDLLELREQINRSHIYDVNCIYGDTDGYITKIIIQA